MITGTGETIYDESTNLNDRIKVDKFGKSLWSILLFWGILLLFQDT